MRISIRGLHKTFAPGHGQAVRAVDDISLEVDHGEFLVVLGPSGSGKTTLLRCIAGLERPDSGEIAIDDRLVYSSKTRAWVPPERRGISMVFQGYALWPHMTVFDNVAYPLRARRAERRSIAGSVQRSLDLVGCGELGHRYPSQLSGGQQQRVAVARAIVGGSGAVLFDEPLSSVDARVREELRAELSELQRSLRFTAVYITHDQTEAVVMAHRVAILSDGKIVQAASPRDIYTRPVSSYAAEFMGAANRYPGTVERDAAGGTVVRTAIGDVRAASGPASGQTSGPAVVIFRPEHCQIVSTAPEPGPANALRGAIERATFLGFCTEYLVRINDAAVAVRSMSRPVLSEGATAWVTVGPDDVLLLPAE